NAMLDQLIAGARALKSVRSPQHEAEAAYFDPGDVASDGTVTHHDIGGCQLWVSRGCRRRAPGWQLE
ncbi:MAG: hypothetical protein ABWY07_06475, partial [Burkholderiales bacterium]